MFNIVFIFIVGLSHKGTLYNPTHFAQTKVPDDVPIVFVFGAMAVGSIDITEHPYVSVCDLCRDIYVSMPPLYVFLGVYANSKYPYL